MNTFSCSLFSCISLRFCLESLKESLDTSSISFVPLPSLICTSLPGRAEGDLDERNQLWFSVKFSRADKQALPQELYLLMELQETEGNGNHLVHFCSKCKEKREKVIEIPEKRSIVRESEGNFETWIHINEQCAHRSANPFGSPRVRFFFTLKLYEVYSPTSSPFHPNDLHFVASFRSSEIKVVAPGKNRIATPSSNKPKTNGKTKSQLTTKQMILTLIQNMETFQKTFDEKFSNFESRIAYLEQITNK